MSRPIDAQEFLRRFRLALSPLPAAERDEIAREVGSHIADRSLDADALARAFGAPEAYAGEFLAERSLRGALASGTPWALGRALLGAVGQVWALLVVVPLVVLQVMAVTLVALGVVKPFAPAHIGLFLDAGGGLRLVGYSSSVPAGVHDVLGAWATPAFIVAGVAIGWASQTAMRALAAGRLRRAARVRVA
jgi:uncharacterized membrane protein